MTMRTVTEAVLHKCDSHFAARGYDADKGIRADIARALASRPETVASGDRASVLEEAARIAEDWKPAENEAWSKDARQAFVWAGAHIATAIRALASTPPAPAGQDDPELDGTDFAHPAWWRGNDAGVEAVVRIADEILDGKEVKGVNGSPTLQALRLRLARLATAERERDEVRVEMERRSARSGREPGSGPSRKGRSRPRRGAAADRGEGGRGN